MARRFVSLLLVLITIVMFTAGCNLPFIGGEDQSAGKTPEGLPGEASTPQQEALTDLQQDSATDLAVQFEDGFPVFVSGRIPVEGNNPGERAKTFMAEYQALYFSDPDLELQVRRVGGVEGQDVTFFQTYQGLEIFGAELVVNLDQDEVYATYGNLLTEISLETTPTVSSEEAEAAALATAEAPDSDILGTTQLLVFDRSLLEDIETDPKLAWRVTVGEPGYQMVFVDALSGDVLFQFGLAVDAIDLDFKDANYTDSVACYFLSPDDQSIGNESGVLNSAYLGDIDATSGYQFSFDMYDFFLDNFGRDSYNGTGGEVEVYIHANVPNAQYIGYGCHYIEFADGWVSWDVIVHEFTHGIIQNTSGLVYANQSGALNEAYSDLMAAFADPDDWTMAEDRTSGMGPIRDLSNPPAFGHPDRFGSFVVMSGDNGGVHTNSGILNKVGFLISDGGTFNTWTIDGLGRARMASLFYSVMVSLPSSANFMTARNATVARADATMTPRDACQVQNAFAAADLGEGDRDCDGIDDNLDPNPDGDFIPADRDNCPSIFNPRQDDSDFDGTGDACDNDIDGDFISNRDDNCPLVHNPSQADVDGNGIGNACQDTDSDGIIDGRDNCPAQHNPGQEDMDGDGDGDLCDSNIDDDPFPNATDLCPAIATTTQVDSDDDGVGDECDVCPADADPDQRDRDGDGIGDACDPDRDGDGFNNDEDNCPYEDNPDQIDLDNNGVGLACDENENQVRDGIEFPIGMFADPGWLTRFPIPICFADCPDTFGPDYLVGILIGLNLPATFWVTDDTGQNVSPPRDLGDGIFQMEFSPIGGREYFLNIAFGKDTPEDSFGEGTMEMYSTSAAAEDEPEEQTATPTAAQSTDPVIEYYADPTEVDAGQCTTIYWKVENVQKVEFGGSEQEFEGSYYDCICQTSTYPMTVTYLDNTQEKFYVTIEVEGSCETPTPPTPTDTPKPEKPAPPSSLAANTNVCNANNYNVHLTWKDNANNETGFRVYRDGNLIATLGPNVTEYNDQPPYGGPYTYTVESYNGGGASPSNNADDSGCIY